MSKSKVQNKKVIEDSEEDSSSELPLIVNKKEAIKAKKQVKKKPAPQESSQEEETPVVTKGKARKQSMEEEAPKKSTKAPVKAVQKKQESSEEESQDEAPKKVVVTKSKSPIQKPVVAKKKVVVQESSDESSEEEAPKKVAKSPLQKAKSPLAKVAKKPVKKETSSEEESEEQVKPVAKKAVVAKSPLQKPVANNKKKQESSDESEQQKPKAKVAKKVVKKAETEQSQEQQKPKAPVRKVSNDIKQAPKVVAKKPEPMVEDDEQGEFEVCVQGLSFNAYDNDIRQFMESCGEIININVLMRPDGKPKGIAFVKFSRKSALNNALAKSGEEHMGRSIKIEQARGKATASGDSMPGRGGRNNSFGGKPQFENNAVIETPTLFIGGLSYNSTAESIKEHFSSVGAVQSARVVTDRQTQKPRGFGYIEFYDVETAKNAYATLNGSYLDGRSIRLDTAAQRDRPAGGFGGNQGGFGGNRGGFGGGSRGGFGGNNSRNPGNSTVILSEDDKNAKKGAIGTFQGKKVTF